MLEEIKKYDDYFWLRYLSEHTVFDTENIKAQKDWLIAEVEKLQQENERYKEALDKAHVLLEKYETMLE